MDQIKNLTEDKNKLLKDLNELREILNKTDDRLKI
jgi:hypothetical protein